MNGKPKKKKKKKRKEKKKNSQDLAADAIAPSTQIPPNGRPFLSRKLPQSLICGAVPETAFK
jgi:hypothetical protein